MKLQEKHEKAFELYYEYRSISQISKEMKVSRQSLQAWKKNFKWDERCAIRENDIAAGIDEKYVAGVVDKKAEMLIDLGKLDMMIDQEVITAFTKDKSGKMVPIIHIEKLKDLVDMLGLKLKIIDSKLKVLGEDIQKVDLRGTIEHNDVNIDKKIVGVFGDWLASQPDQGDKADDAVE